MKDCQDWVDEAGEQLAADAEAVITKEQIQQQLGKVKVGL